jgi:putative ABC transport system ATP-binding protein
MNVIELRNISKRFADAAPGEPPILEQIDLVIAKGEFVAIMGPSGSGKSTLMNIIGLLDISTGGDYLLDGQKVAAKNDSDLAVLRREKIGFVFQSFNLLNRMTVLANVEVPMIYSGVSAKKRRARALELLDLVGVKDRAKARPNRISGGQAQRVAIARALANKPSLILADEPTGNLDSKSSRAVMDLIHQLHQNGTTIVMVTHNPELAHEADRTIHVRDGQIVESVATQIKQEHKPGVRRLVKTPTVPRRSMGL